MKILISNDDGIEAVGIYELVRALSEVAEVYVCAPHQQRSAASHSISFRDPIRVRRTEFDNAVMALETTGTPHAIASRGGIPKPSYMEGNTKAHAPFIRGQISSSGIYFVN